MSKKKSKKRRSGAPRPSGQRKAEAPSSSSPGSTAKGSGHQEPVRHPGVSVSRAREELTASGQREGSPGILVAALLGTTVFMFGYYHLLVLQQMTQLTGGMPMPDSMVFGYDAAYIGQLAGVMDEAALGQLNWVHKTAGVIFPLAFGLSVIVVAAWCLPRSSGRRAIYAAGLLFAVVDIWENFAIEEALLAGGDGAELASILTVVRWALVIALSIGMAVLLMTRWRRSLRQRAEGARSA